MQQGSVLEDGRHGPCLCKHLQGKAQNSEQMGEQGVCGGMAALPEPTSICGMSNRQRRVQPYPAQELPVAHQWKSGTGKMWKFCWGEMDPVMNQVQYHMRMMHCQLTTQWMWTRKHAWFTIKRVQTVWPRVDCINKNGSHRWKASSWQWYTFSTKAKLKNSEEPNPMEVSEFCITAKWHLSQYLQYLGWPMHLPSHHLPCAHHLCGEYSMKTLSLNHHKSAQYKWFLVLMGIPSMLTIWWIFGLGEWNKGYLVQT